MFRTPCEYPSSTIGHLDHTRYYLYLDETDLDPTSTILRRGIQGPKDDRRQCRTEMDTKRWVQKEVTGLPPSMWDAKGFSWA